ncbi:MAG: rRNA cytosine-C5-methyltransferase, partial [Elusimicrobiaceae bacterium]|nr:rRNA cytosine-C5-methyltransferase [Elusimicrobiaceae bacterium]
SVAQALSITMPPDAYPRAELTLPDAQRYLHRESLVLPPTAPRGFVMVTYQGHALGFVKNLGERANNLYPKNWAIKKL